MILPVAGLRITAPSQPLRNMLVFTLGRSLGDMNMDRKMEVAVLGAAHNFGSQLHYEAGSGCSKPLANFNGPKLKTLTDSSSTPELSNPVLTRLDSYELEFRGSVAAEFELRTARW